MFRRLDDFVETLTELMDYSFGFKYCVAWTGILIVAAYLSIIRLDLFEILSSLGAPMDSPMARGMVPITLFICAGCFFLLAFIWELFARLFRNWFGI